MSFIGRSSFDQPVTCAWAPVSSPHRLLATATLDGGGVGFGDVDSDFYSQLSLNEIDYNANSGVLVEKLSVKVHNQRFASLAWGNHGLLAGGMTDGTVKLWDSTTLAHKQDISRTAAGSGPNVFIRAVQFHPTLQQLAHSGPKKQVMVTDLASAQVLLEMPSQGEVSALAWNLSDTAKHILASGNLDSTTSVWDLRTKKATCEIRDPRGASVACVAWSPNARQNSYHLLIANDCGMLRLFDLRSSTSTPMSEVQATSASNVGIFDLDWCPQDDNLLVTCSKDNRMLLWDLESSQVLCEMQQDTPHAHPPSQTSNRRYQVDWSPKTPGLIAACSFDRSLQLFSLTNSLARCPAWVKRTSKGASFGFGGRLVEFTPDRQVAISNVHADARWAELLDFERKLDISIKHDEESATRDHLALFCSEQQAAAKTEAVREIWQVLRVLLADNTRVATQDFLGYREEEIIAQTDAKTTEEEQELVTRALTIGRFDIAVELSFKFKRYDEGLYLATLGGAELLQRAQEMFLEAKEESSKVLQLARSILNPNHPGGEDWKQQLALLGSFAPAEDYANQVNHLALSQELGPQTVCYMLARNVSKVSECWTRAIPRDEEFCEIGQVFARVLAAGSNSSGGSGDVQSDRVMMNRFARLANRMADEGEFELAKKYASIASAVDYEAADLVQRIEYGLVWNAESEQRAREEEERWRAQQEAEARAQAEQAALLAQQQAEQEALYAKQQAEQAAIYAQQQQQYAQQQQQQYYQPQQYNAYAPPAPAMGYGQQAPYGQQQQYAAPPPQQYAAPPPQQYAAPPPQQYAPPPPQQYAPSPPQQYAPPPQQYSAPPPPQQYAPPPPPVQQQYSPPAVAAPPPVYHAPPPQYTAAATTPPAPRVPENDGFGTTAGNANAGAKYGNRTANAPTSVSTQQPAASAAAAVMTAPKPIDPALQYAVSALQRATAALKQRVPPSSMEERRLVEAEKGLVSLSQSLPLLNDFFQLKLKELAAAVERGSYAEAHNIQLTLSSSADWKEHKDWIKGLSHLIGVAQKVEASAAPPKQQQHGGGPPLASSGPSYTPQQYPVYQ